MTNPCEICGDPAIDGRRCRACRMAMAKSAALNSTPPDTWEPSEEDLENSLDPEAHSKWRVADSLTPPDTQGGGEAVGERFERLSDEPRAQMPEGYSAPMDMRPTRQVFREEWERSPSLANPAARGVGRESIARAIFDTQLWPGAWSQASEPNKSTAYAQADMVLKLLFPAQPAGPAVDLEGLAKEIEEAASLIGIAGLNPYGPHDDATLAKADGLRVAAKMVRAALTAHPAASTSQAAIDVLTERRRQVEVEGWTPEHDDEHGNGEMAAAAACYAVGRRTLTDPSRGTGEFGQPVWPWDSHWWKPDSHRRELVKAGALILAEIERLDRASTSQGGERG